MCNACGSHCHDETDTHLCVVPDVLGICKWGMRTCCRSLCHHSPSRVGHRQFCCGIMRHYDAGCCAGSLNLCTKGFSVPLCCNSSCRAAPALKLAPIDNPHTSLCIVAPGLVNPGHMMFAPDSTNLIAPLSVRSLGIMSGYWCRMRSAGNQWPSRSE